MRTLTDPLMKIFGFNFDSTNPILIGYYQVRQFMLPAGDCLSYLASTETVCDLLLPAETVVLGKQLPTETVGVI